MNPKDRFISPSELSLDPENPRIRPGRNASSEPDLLRIMIEEFNLQELAESIIASGYLPYEPLLVVETEGKYVVVEGNRRTAAVKCLLSPDIVPERNKKKWKELNGKVTPEIRASMEKLPAIVFPNRSSSELVSYVANRHVSGPLKWQALEKAAYISTLVDQQWNHNTIAEKLGSYPSYILKHYTAYQMTEQAAQEKVPGYEQMRDAFGVLLRALQSPGINAFLGIEDINTPEKNPIPDSKKEQFAEFIKWTFGTDDSAKILPDSRDLTNWGEILKSDESLEYLRFTSRPTFARAWELSGGEKQSVIEVIWAASNRLEEYALKIKRYKDVEKVQKAVSICTNALRVILEDFPDIAKENRIKIINND